MRAREASRGLSRAHIVLDLSRLLSRADRATPTGIDRVELAYAKHLAAREAQRLDFAAVWKNGRLGLLPRERAEGLVAALDARWRGAGGPAAARWPVVLRLMAGGEGALERALGGGTGVYLLVSHHHLDRPSVIETLKRRAGARFACFIHDLIPMQYPEYARPGQAERHRRRIETAVALADALIVNSDDTRAALLPLLRAAGRDPALLVAPLGTEPLAAERGGGTAAKPYFICIGTIEPKKNHLLLLNLWRRLAEELGEAAPRLVLVGQRGWENENAIDMLERAPAICALVEERASVADRDLARLVAGASALLLPSFAEGYGLPVAEALSLGTPVICSDLPALREVGKDVPDYLDPLDGRGWRDAVLAYRDRDSPRRLAQLRRLAFWQPPDWERHFAAVVPLLDALAGRP